jgi:hypothetical protein
VPVVTCLGIQLIFGNISLNGEERIMFQIRKNILEIFLLAIYVE